MTTRFPPVDAERMFEELTQREAVADPRLGRLRALKLLGRTFEVSLFVDARPPRTHLFAKPPSLMQVADLITDLDVHDHLVAVRLTTHSFSMLRVPSFVLEPENTGINRPWVAEAAE